MANFYRVSYVLSEITQRTDIFEMEDDTPEAAIKAIQKEFNGVWGFRPDEIQIAKIVSGHYADKPYTDIRARILPPGMTRKVFEDGAVVYAADCKIFC